MIAAADQTILQWLNSYLAQADWMMLPLVMALALLLDAIFAEPKRYHPLVGFGHWANQVEQRLNQASSQWLKLRGIIAVGIAIVPLVALAGLLEWVCQDNPLLEWVVAAILLYSAIGWQSLIQHGQRISKPLRHGDFVAARQALSMIVSRDTQDLEDNQIAKAATESMLENGADAIFSAIFWFCVLGIPGIVLYRLSNTLDAMWGYKNTRFVQFGWCAARLDDVLNYIPARLTALSYVLAGHLLTGIRYWRLQGGQWKSPNAGPVMAAGAGALNVSLGGAAVYHGQIDQRPVLGPSESTATVATGAHIDAAIQLVNRALGIWFGGLLLIAILMI